MKSHSFLSCGALLCNAAAAFFIPYVRSPSLVQGDASAIGPDGKPPSCLDGGNVTLYETSLPNKRSIDGSCGSHQSLVDQAYKDCAARARAGERIARAKDSASSALIKDIFKDDSDQTRNHIADHLALIAVECEKNGGGPTPVKCGYCKPGVAGLTVLVSDQKDGSNEVTLCDVAIHPEQNHCDRQVLGDVLLHELSHSWGLTKDRAYGIKDIKHTLSTSASLENADSYTVFAKSAKLGCVVQGDRLVEGSSKGGEPGGVDAGNPPGDGKDNGNNNGSNNGDDGGDDGESAGGNKGQPKPSTSRQGGSGNKPTTSAKGPGGARSSSSPSPSHPTSKPPGGRQGGSGGMPTSSAKGPGRGQPSSPSSPPRPSGKPPGGEQDGSDDEGDEGDDDGPCSYQNTKAPHSVSTVTSTTVIRPRRSTVIVTVTNTPTSTVIVTVTGYR
ncbi:hypothetical protein E4U56_000640 [Claviceps arundinis]|uniref:Lysine-specific metallo-endopeptidase domain-containing protein n=1 Tax=Claviceps arundinis TaxID=1623583 RepID=A0A9P7MTG7_9HYPO|nr:hypothetical protein E4U56_000640 [Claviceps arundinis]